MRKPEEIITDAEVIAVHGYANFGSMTPREVVNDGVRKYAIGYSGGHTQQCILREHGLITKPKGYSADLTKKGKEYARSIGDEAQAEIARLTAERDALRAELSSENAQASGGESPRIYWVWGTRIFLTKNGAERARMQDEKENPHIAGFFEVRRFVEITKREEVVMLPEHKFAEAEIQRKEAEARDAVLEEAATALRPMLRGMISRSEAARVIRELKGKP